MQPKYMIHSLNLFHNQLLNRVTSKQAVYHLYLGMIDISTDICITSICGHIYITVSISEEQKLVK